MPHRPDHILSDRERRFVDEYLIDCNQTRAAQRAGYSRRSSGKIGMRLMQRPRVRAAVERAMERRAQRLEVDQDRVVQALAAMAFGDPRTLFDDTGTLLPLHRLPDEAAALVAGLEIVASVKPGAKAGATSDHGADHTGTAYVARIRIADRLKALELLGRHLGLFDGGSAGRPASGDGDVPSFEVRFVEAKPANDAGAGATGVGGGA